MTPTSPEQHAFRRARRKWREEHYAGYRRRLGGAELSSKHYDETFAAARQDLANRYSVSPEESGYIKSWNQVIEWLGTESRVADFGCGPGQFAEFAVARDVNYVLGVDFSPVAIEWAKARNPSRGGTFYAGDVCDGNVHELATYDVAVFLEILEHIESDVLALSLVPEGKEVILSVPSYAMSTHVRCFKGMEDVVKRYQRQLDIHETKRIRIGNMYRVLWLVRGTRF